MRDWSHVPHLRQHFVFGVRKRWAKKLCQATRDGNGARTADEQHRHAEKRQLRSLKRLAKQRIEVLEHSANARGDRNLFSAGQ